MEVSSELRPGYARPQVQRRRRRHDGVHSSPEWAAEPGRFTRVPSRSTQRVILSARSTKNGEKGEINVKAVFDIERPKHLSMKTQVDGDAGKGPDVIADGKKVIIHGKSRKEYVEEDSPDGLEGIGFRLLQIGATMTGMLFANVLADEPGDMLMQGVDSCSYVGKDKVGDTPVHRMKFSQEGFDWELWVATEGKPLIF